MHSLAAKSLLEANNILIITHLRPDGDTLGSAYALYYALKDIGKNVCVACHTKITPKYQIITNGQSDLKPLFAPNFIVAVDIADVKLFGVSLKKYAEKIDISIDHHPTNEGYAKLNVIEPNSSSTGEVVLKIIEKMGVNVSKQIADCIYISISTDTGCFRYANTTADSFRTAAKLFDLGADVNYFNRRFFEIRTRCQIEIERLALQNLNFYRNGTVAIIVVTLDMINKTGATEDDVEGLSAFPRIIEGVEVGMTIREIKQNEFKVSSRSNGLIDVAEICSKYGGGGHKRAAGCTIKGDIKDIEKSLVDSICVSFDEIENIDN